jgi:hypothetical protein
MITSLESIFFCYKYESKTCDCSKVILKLSREDLFKCVACMLYLPQRLHSNQLLRILKKNEQTAVSHLIDQRVCMR